MSNGNSKQMWDIVFKVSQLVAPLVLAAMVYLIIGQSSLDKRLAVLESQVGKQPVDTNMIRLIAVIEERQTSVINRLNAMDVMLQTHREKSTYDKR